MTQPTRREVRFPQTRRPVLTVVIDCEEGFDWSRPVQGTPYDLDSIARLHRVAERVRKLGVTLTFMATHPVLQDTAAWGHLAELVASDDAILGAHLHPWVTPPFGEAPTVFNSYQGNLPREIEAAKVRTLVDGLVARTGRRPTLFKAGRSGFGPHTAAILAEQGFEIDLSFMPCWTYEAQGGPSFVDVASDPFFFEVPGQAALFEIPDTAGFVGGARRLGRRMFPLVDTPGFRRLRVPAALSRSGLLNRIPLTPEGVSQTEARRLTHQLHADGLRVFQLSFHSTSLVPGNTSYVADERGVTGLLDWVEDYITFFTATLGGAVVTPTEILDAARHDGAVAPPVPRPRAAG